MYLCTSGSIRDTISYFPIYMKHCTVSQANNEEGDTLFCTRCNIEALGINLKIEHLSSFLKI